MLDEREEKLFKYLEEMHEKEKGKKNKRYLYLNDDRHLRGKDDNSRTEKED